MTSFKDIFKKSFVSGDAYDLSIQNVVMALLISFVCGMIIYFIYRRFYKGVIYSNNFNVLLVMVSIVTTFIVLTISSNVVLSLGMVGALSIVRFRTAVKDPLDVGFLFWAIAVGITCGAGLYMMSVICTLMISVIYVMLVNFRSGARVFLLVVKYENGVNEDVQRLLTQMKYSLKNKTTLKGKTELTLELKLKGDNTSFVTNLSDIPGVYSASLIEFTGDFGE